MPVEKPALPGEERSRPGSKGQSAPPRKVAGGSGASRKSPCPASEGEKDSGFSDESSEYLSNVEQTDTKEQPAYPRRQPATVQRVPQRASGGLGSGTFTGLAPVYVVRNVLLKQPLGVSPTAQFLAWSSQQQLDSAQGPPARVLLIQQPATALKPLAKEPSLPPTYYPRIAPRPGQDAQAKGAGLPPAGAASKNKRFCLGEAWVSSSAPAAPGGGREPPPPPATALVSLEVSLSPGAVTSSTGPALPGLEQAEGRLLSRASRRLGGSSQGRQRRFQNTVEILRKSGLLGIALRTKELIRQSSSTQRDLAELREHTQLLSEAVRSNDAQAWSRLQEAMARSAAYWADKGASTPAPPGQSLAAEPARPPSDAASEAPPSSPLPLALATDTLGPVALP
ncbi:hypothetical protein lerEdw1_009950 [Lerista edwardsae]|nr:hypothetical protein lerEdw1_009950 [Lerista edwardsae]